jgi:hypothetical protein
MHSSEEGCLYCPALWSLLESKQLCCKRQRSCIRLTALVACSVPKWLSEAPEQLHVKRVEVQSKGKARQG